MSINSGKGAQHHGDLPGYVGRIDGVQGAVDLNDCCWDYPAIMRAAGENGYPKPDASTPPDKPTEAPDYKAMYKSAEARAYAAEARAAAAEEKIAALTAILL